MNRCCFAVSALLAAVAAWSDEGVYDLKLMGEAIGTVSFKTEEPGAYETNVKATVGQTKLNTTLKIRPKNGLPAEVDYVVKSPEEVTVEYRFEGLKGKGKARGEKFDATLPEKGAIFENVNPYILKNILDTYDLAKGGKQDLKALDVGSTNTYTFSAGLVKTTQRAVGGKNVPVREWNLRVVVVDSTLTTDTNNKPLVWIVKAQNFEAVLRGYEELLAEAPVDPLLSKPEHEVAHEADVRIPMRDGVRLQADVYRPEGEGRFPVILSRSAYSRAQGAVEGPFFARRGYVYVIQDVRGRGGSEGEWEPLVNEARDGFDTVEWCASQPWSTGKVGMIGGSYGGWVQWAVAKEKPRGLAALIPMVSPPDPFFNFPYDYGAFLLTGALWWANVVRERDPNLAATEDLGPALNTLPLNKVDDAFFGENIPWFDKWLEHDTYDDYWKGISFLPFLHRINLPVLHISGWYDGDAVGTQMNYQGMIACGKPNQKLVYGPWPHFLNTTTTLGEMDFGPDSIIDLQTLTLRWFDRWLKGIENGIDAEPPVSLFIMGENRWVYGDQWPPEDVRMREWYLRSGGALSPEPPGVEAPDRYVYDPIPQKIEEEFKVDLTEFASSSLDVSAVADDPGVLVYDTEVLDEPVTVLGPVSMRLYASTSAVDTDWSAMLADARPDGRAIYLCLGKMRARFRGSWSEPAPLEPGRVYAYDLDMWATGIRFDKGHRIRLIISSSLFPRYDRNLNTGEPIAGAIEGVAARQAIYHDSTRASFVLLPILSEGRGAGERAGWTPRATWLTGLSAPGASSRHP